MRARYEEIDDLGGLVNSLRAIATRREVENYQVFIDNGATAIEGLLGENAQLKADLVREREARRIVDQALANALGQLKAANDSEPEPDGIR